MLGYYLLFPWAPGSVTFLSSGVKFQKRRCVVGRLLLVLCTVETCRGGVRREGERERWQRLHLVCETVYCVLPWEQATPHDMSTWCFLTTANIVSLLLEHKASTTLQNSRTETPAQCAQSRKVCWLSFIICAIQLDCRSVSGAGIALSCKKKVRWRTWKGQ